MTGNPSEPQPVTHNDDEAKPQSTTQELIDEALANATIDAGEYGTSAETGAPKRGRGRPPIYVQSDIIQVLQFYRANETFFSTLETFHTCLKNWLGAEKTPSLSLLRNWLEELRQQPSVPQP
jgi:hypothetical protein